MTMLTELGAAVKASAHVLASASTQQKNGALLRGATSLRAAAVSILEANRADLEAAKGQGVGATALDRLRLDEQRIEAMAAALEAVSALPDPVGEVADGWVRPNGLRIRRVRVPLGVVGVIYENRPNVTSDAAGLCLKSGNAAFLRGSSAALRSNQAIVAALRSAVVDAGLPAAAVTLVEATSRESAVEFMKLRGVIDCLVPRGGRGLLDAIAEHATVPYIVDGDGNCHVYVDAAADLDMAESIVVNAKTSRPSVCNAAESLLVHASIAHSFLPRVAAAMPNVELVGDEASRGVVPTMGIATEEDFATEFLDLKMSVAVVDSVEAAISHVNRYSTGHTEAIVTNDFRAAEAFTQRVDAAVVAVNASTRFTDGGEFGFGAEIGNSTQKLHVRGPMGVRELTTLKYVVTGDGQVR